MGIAVLTTHNGKEFSFQKKKNKQWIFGAMGAKVALKNGFPYHFQKGFPEIDNGSKVTFTILLDLTPQKEGNGTLSVSINDGAFF